MTSAKPLLGKSIEPSCLFRRHRPVFSDARRDRKPSGVPEVDVSVLLRKRGQVKQKKGAAVLQLLV